MLTATKVKAFIKIQSLNYLTEIYKLKYIFFCSAYFLKINRSEYFGYWGNQAFSDYEVINK